MTDQPAGHRPLRTPPIVPARPPVPPLRDAVDRAAPPSSFVLWLDASDGSVPTHDGFAWPDGTATVHHRHFGHTTTHADPEAARQSAHGKQGRIVWPETAPADRAAALNRAADFFRGLHATGTTISAQEAEQELRRMADEVQQPEATPCDQPNACDAESGELCATHEEKQAHAEGEHAFCGPTCEVVFPTELLRNSILAKGYPGTAGMLDELLRRATAGLLPAAVQQPKEARPSCTCQYIAEPWIKMDHAADCPAGATS